jgi:two-component system phosphate regulon sensor histidine kinase PhoR
VGTTHGQRYSAGFVADPGSVSTVVDRLRHISQAQLPFVVILGVVTAGLGVADRSRIAAPSYLCAVVLAVVATAVALVLPWERISRSWVWAIALSDFAVVALLSESLSEAFPAIIVLIVFPVMWMAYEFGIRAVPYSLAASVVAVLFPHVGTGAWAISAIEVAGLTVRAAFILLFAVSVGIMSDQLRASRRMVGEISTELRASLAASEDRELTLRAVIDTVGAAIVVFDTDGGVVTTNETAHALYEKTGTDPNSSAPLEGLIFRRDRRTPVPRSDGIIARALRDEPLAGRVYWLGEGEAQVAVTAGARRMHRADGAVLGTVIVAHDVTALVEAVSVRDDFLASVSHELKTPLTNIIGYLEVIDGAAPSIADELTIIQKNADRLLALVTQLLSAGGRSAAVHRLPADVSDIVARKAASFSDAAAAKSITLTHPEGSGIVAEVDPNALRTMVDHLASNALKFTPVGGLVTVGVDSRDGYAWIRVADTGIGIASEHQRQVYDRFFRAPLARAGAVPGTGLGLSIVKALVDAHGGVIELASSPGTGTTIRVGLPLHKSAHSH